jgi:hypothetical protein
MHHYLTKEHASCRLQSDVLCGRNGSSEKRFAN